MFPDKNIDSPIEIVGWDMQVVRLYILILKTFPSFTQIMQFNTAMVI